MALFNKKTDRQFCVIGLGAFGYSLATSLAQNGAVVLAIDSDQKKVEAIKNHVSSAIQFDATDPDLLAEHGAINADVVIIAIGEAFEPVVLIAMEMLKADVKRVIARAGSKTQEMILNRIGIEEVVHPEKDEGQRKATSLIRANVTDYFELSDEFSIFEIETPDKFIGYTLKDLELRQRYGINLLTIKRKRPVERQTKSEARYQFDVLGMVDGDTKILKEDHILVMGTNEAVERLIELA